MIADLLSLAAYDYHLPKELIAQYPTDKRAGSKLMHISRSSGHISHRSFTDILDMLHRGDVLIINSSKVFPARLFAKKENGTAIEVLLLSQICENKWKCMVSPGKRVRTAQNLYFSDNLFGWVGQGDSEGLREIEFTCKVNLWDEIERIGHIPLPPYIERNDGLMDKQRYQTVYAREIGSVAAPTAGLHFDTDMLEALAAKGVTIKEVVLHVGIGTFRPVKVQRITDHIMHAELATIPADTAEAINCARQEKRRVICVGTTSSRSVESFWDGTKLLSGSKWTDIFIYPGYTFKVVDAMLTNFHLPQSTLLMMISAFGGYDTIRRAYSMAVEQNYRFFSYGDAMFIED